MSAADFPEVEETESLVLFSKGIAPHRNVNVVDDVFRRASGEQMAQAFQRVGCHGDHIHLFILSKIDNAVIFVPVVSEIGLVVSQAIMVSKLFQRFFSLEIPPEIRGCVDQQNVQGGIKERLEVFYFFDEVHLIKVKGVGQQDVFYR